MLLATLGGIAALILGGLTYFFAVMTLENIRSRDWALATIIAILGVLIVGLLAMLAWVIYDMAFVEHKTFGLRTDQWSCTDRRTQTTLMPMRSGNTTIMLPQTTTFCVEYSKKGY